MDDVEDLIEELHGCVELLVRNFFDFSLDVFLLGASIEGAVEEIKRAELERNSDMAHIDSERN